MRLLKLLVPVVAVGFVGGQVVNAVQGSALASLIFGVATAVLGVWVYARAVRWSERRVPIEVATTGAVARIGVGAAIGVGWFAAVMVSVAMLGDYHIDRFGSVAGALGLVGSMAAAAVSEELVFRGVLFRVIEDRAGTWTALTLTSVMFGLLHLVNPDATLWGAISIAVEAGGTLAAAYAATRTLWVPIGLHFGWNYAEAGLFGTEVSGSGKTEGLLHSVTSGPALITGGQFGPEASIFSVLSGVVMTIVFLRLARRRGTLVPRRRAARSAATATLAP